MSKRSADKHGPGKPDQPGPEERAGTENVYPLPRKAERRAKERATGESVSPGPLSDDNAVGDFNRSFIRWRLLGWAAFVVLLIALLAFSFLG